MATREQLIRIGAGLPSPRLLEQADYSIALMKEDGAALATGGWPAARTIESARLRAEVARLFSDQATAKNDIPAASATVGAATRAAKTWKRTTLLWAGNAFDDAPETLDDFCAGGAIGASTPRLVAYLTRTVPLVEKHAAALAAEGAPADLAAQGRSLLDALTSTNATQELDIRSLPTATAALYETKGTLYRLLKKLNRVGRAIHDGDAAKAARYHLALLHRGGARAARPGAPADK